MFRRACAEGTAGPPKFHAAVAAIPDIAAELGRRGERYEHRLLAHDIVSRTAPDCQMDTDGPILVLRSVHRMGGRAFLEERLINLHAVPEAVLVDFTATPPSSWLLRNVAWTEAEHRISAASADEWTALALGVPPSDACLVLERRTWRGCDQITYVQLTFPGQDCDLAARFQPRWQALAS